MTQYLMLVKEPEPGTDPYDVEGVREQSAKDVDQYDERLRAEGHWVFSGALDFSGPLVLADGQGDRPVFTDGPYPEAKEVIGGFWIIEAPDDETARLLAIGASKACRRTIHLQPFLP
jgi:hypothetical protein